MKQQIFASSFLTYNDEMLLMQRGLHKKYAPGMWASIGGHMESNELNNPIATAFREIGEETGVPPSEISDLELRYITIRHAEDEIRISYYFFGRLNQKPSLHECDEGALHWVNIKEIQNLPMTYSNKDIINHWLANPNSTKIFLRAASHDYTTATWAEL